MPARNYIKDAKARQKTLFDNPRISNDNKELIKEFLIAFDVSHARLAIFFRHITPVLEAIPNIRDSLQDKKTYNKVFKELRDSRSLAFYSTCQGCAVRLLKWLNNNESPVCMKDIKRVAKSKIRRDLKPSDMVTWPDALKMIEKTNNLMMKAALMVQLDGGFRPSEFADLKFGDIIRSQNKLIASVSDDHKTGKRQVILIRSVPYLQQWLSIHPTKETNAPLWIRSGKAYNFASIQKAIKIMGKLANIKKPLDWYNLRHSAAYNMKMQNYPVDLAARKLGHSAQFYNDVYGRLSVEDDIKRIDLAEGIIQKEEADKNKPLVCNRCKEINEADSKYCSRCNFPLSEEAVKELEESSNQAKETQERLRLMEQAIASLIENRLKGSPK